MFSEVDIECNGDFPRKSLNSINIISNFFWEDLQK